MKKIRILYFYQSYLKNLIHFVNKDFIHLDYKPTHPLRVVPLNIRLDLLFINVLFWFGSLFFIATFSIAVIEVSNNRNSFDIIGIVFFVLLSVALLIYALNLSLNALLLLRYGILVSAKVINLHYIEPKGEDNSPTYDVELEFTSIRNLLERTKINISMVNMDKYPIEKNVLILYLPWDISRSDLYNNLGANEKWLVNK